MTVSLRGWQPYIVDFPEVPPLPNEARGTIWDYTRLEFSNGRRVSFKARPFNAHATPIPTGVTIDVATWQRTTMESGTLRVDEASNLLRRD